MEDTILTTLDKDKLTNLFDQTATNVEYFSDTSSKIIKQYSSALDNLMSDVYIQCIRDGDDSIEALSKYYLELANMVYFMVDKVEEIGVYADMAKSAAKEVYDKSYRDNQVKEASTGKNKTTVAELQSLAGLSSQYQNVVASIYENAYKVVKGKVSAAQDMMNTLRRILSTRTAEMSLSAYGPNQNQIGFKGTEE